MNATPHLKILIIEDSPEDRALYKRCLRQQGNYEFIETEFGEEGIELAREQHPDCILLDYNLPDLNGIEILQSLGLQGRSTPIVMLTGQSHPDRDITAIKAGASDYLPKERLNGQILDRIIRYSIERKGTERKLRELNEDKNRLLGMAAHDLRNPLTSIRGFSELILEEESVNQQELTELLTIIRNLSQEMLLTLHNLLDIAMIESGKFDVALKQGNLSELLHYRIRLSNIIAKRKEIELIDKIDTTLCAIFDMDRLNQVVDNFLSNAIKYSPKRTRIEISADQIDQMVEVRVKDEGPGIPQEELHHIFGTFQTLSGIKPTGGETSSGLGLAIAKKIIDAHQGEIGVRSRPGSGSEFYFRIPLEDRRKV